MHISVITPVFNGDLEHVSQSIESILNQNFGSFEFIIIDDCSDKPTQQLLESYANSDSRINLIRNIENLGVGESLNVGLSAARTSYIVRHDSDDISLPNRLEQLYLYMENNPEISICCSSVIHIDMNGAVLKEHHTSTESNVLAAELLFNSRICTPSTIMRTEILKELGGFPRLRNAEDYSLFLILASKGYKFGGISIPLLKYRINTNSLTRKFRTQQLEIAEQLSFSYNINLFGELNRESFKRFWYFVALEGESELHYSDLFFLRNMFLFIYGNKSYKEAWFGIFRWISVKSFENNKGVRSLVIAAYFKWFGFIRLVIN